MTLSDHIQNCFLAMALGMSATDAAEPAPQYRFKNVSIPAAAAEEPIRDRFSSAAAKHHLDLGANLWSRQKNCISCHTHGIYLFVRPALTPQWGRPAPEVREFLVRQVEELRTSGDSDGSAPAQSAYMSRGLAAWDAAAGNATSPETAGALRHLLETMQAEDGSIRVKFRFPPINSDTWHGTVTAAIAAATAPGWHDTHKDDNLGSALAKLLAYLRKTPPQNDHQRLQLLWAATFWPELLEEQTRKEIIRHIFNLQRPDGGWSVRSFATPENLGGGAKAARLRTEPDFENPPSDGYQTALAVIVLRDAGIPANDTRLRRAVTWLRTNQRKSGRWWTGSLNTTSRFHYISYSGSAYAALALAKCGALETVDP